MGVAHETRIVDSLQAVLATQEGREKVLTMIELTWDFYDVSFDDCIDWGEKAIKEANVLGFKDLEAKANYVLGLQYAYHGDLDLAKEYLYQSFNQYISIGDTENAFESLWDIATFELTLGNVDTSLKVYEDALAIADEDFYSARAHIYYNMAIIWNSKGEYITALNYFVQAKQLFEFIEADRMATRVDYEIASIKCNRGFSKEAKEVFLETLPKLSEYGDYYIALNICKQLGDYFSNESVNYDSALCYYNRAIEFSQKPIMNKEDEVSIAKDLSSVMVGLANVFARQGNVTEAVIKYNEALESAEKMNFQYGQMEACSGLVELYSNMGQAKKSLQYYERYAELEKSSGITLKRSALRRYLVMDYARLDRFDDMNTLLGEFEDENMALAREIADLYDRNRELEETVTNLVGRMESQDALNEAQTYRLRRHKHFLSGCLAIALAALVLLVAREIVRKNRSKSAYS